MRKLENAIILSRSENRYSNSYRFYCSTIPGDFKKGDLFSVEWHKIDDQEDYALVIFKKEEQKFSGVNRVDSNGRMNFTPPAWVFPPVKEEKKANYGSFSKEEFDFNGGAI